MTSENHNNKEPEQNGLLVRVLLWPGNALCNLLKIPQDSEQRMLLRLWINLVVYTKIAGIAAYYIAR